MAKSNRKTAGSFSLTVDNEFLSTAIQLMSDLPMLLSSAGDSNEVIYSTLRRIGTLLDVSRVFVILDERFSRFANVFHIWSNIALMSSTMPNIRSEKMNRIHAFKSLFTGRRSMACHTREATPELRKHLVSQGVDSILWAPLSRTGPWAGLVGCDCCGFERVWKAEEGCIIRLLADSVAGLMMQKELSLSNQTIAEVHTLINKNTIQEKTAEPTLPTLPLTLRESERRLIKETLEYYNGNKLRAAKHLGLTWPALDRRCKKLDIKVIRKA